LLTLDLKDLEGNVRSAVEFLKSRLDAIKVRGSSVQLRIEHTRDAKQILHKYLRHAGLDGYRVICCQSWTGQGRSPLGDEKGEEHSWEKRSHSRTVGNSSQPMVSTTTQHPPTKEENEQETKAENDSRTGLDSQGRGQYIATLPSGRVIVEN